MNPLTDIVPAIWRKWLYAAYALVGTVIGATQVAIASLDAHQPTWLKVTLAVYAYVGVGFGFTAASNTAPKNPPPDELGDLGAIDVVLLLLLAILFGVVLLLFGVGVHTNK